MISMNYKSIVISGLAGAGKTTLAKELSGIYGWPVYSVGDLWRSRWKQKYPNNEVPFEEYWRTTSTQENQQTDNDFHNIIAKNDVIGDGRYVIHLRDLPVFLVFLSADLDTRAARLFGLEKYKEKTVDEIKQILRRREVDEVALGRRLYNYDYRDSSYYNLVINTKSLSVANEVAIVGSVLPKI
jgi:cytidylate kinase